PFDRRPAGVTETQQLGGLVKGLAGGIVAVRAEHAVLADPGADQQLRVAAGYQQQQIRKADAIREARSQRMGFEMIDRDERLLRRPGDALGGLIVGTMAAKGIAGGVAEPVMAVNDLGGAVRSERLEGGVGGPPPLL